MKTPIIKYLSIENLKTADAIGLQTSTEQTFKRIGTTSIADLLVGLNCDGSPQSCHLMRAIARAHASTRATSLMRVKNSTRHFWL